MAAGYAAISLLTPQEFDRLNALGELPRARLRGAILSAGVQGQVTGMGSLVHLHLTSRAIRDYRSYYRSPQELAWYAQLHRFFLNHGALVAPHEMVALSMVMGKQQIDQLAETLLQVLRSMNFEEDAAE